MGIDYTHQIGPMILIDVAPRQVEKSRLCCPDKECKQYWKRTDANFCSICGKEIMEHHYYKEQDVTWWDFMRSLEDTHSRHADFEERFICPEYLSTSNRVVVISNMTATNRHLDENDFVILSTGSMKSMDIAGKLREFKDGHVRYLERIEDFFGKGNVNVEYAVCSYTS